MKLTLNRINKTVRETLDDDTPSEDMILLSEEEVDSLWKFCRSKKLNSERINADELDETIAEAFKIQQALLYKKTRKNEIVIARDIAFFLLYITQYDSLTKIGDRYNKDHATVIHGKELIWDILKYGKKTGDSRRPIIIKVLEHFNMWDKEKEWVKSGYIVKDGKTYPITTDRSKLWSKRV